MFSRNVILYTDFKVGYLHVKLAIVADLFVLIQMNYDELILLDNSGKMLLNAKIDLLMREYFRQ